MSITRNTSHYSLILVLLFCAVLCLSGTAHAQLNAGNQDLSTGTAVLANGLDSNGNPVNMYNYSGPNTGSNAYRFVENTPTGEQAGNGIRDTTNSGYADMHRTTRNTDEADGYYVRDGYLNNRYFGVIDFGITRDANWTTAYTVADVAVSGQGLGGLAPGRADNTVTPTWGSAARQQGIADFLKDFRASDGYIDNFVVQGAVGTVLGKGVFASTAELYGNAQMNAAGGLFDQLRARGYHAGTNYQGGLIHMGNSGLGVLGQSGGYYFDEGGQYTMDALGNITFNNGPRTETYGSSQNSTYNTTSTRGAGAVAYDDWNQHGIVMTGLDLIAYTTSFNAALFGEAAHIYGNFSVMGDFLDVYINGNLISWDSWFVDGLTYGTGNVLGEYAMMLDLAAIDAAFWDADGMNDISFMVRTMSAWELGLDANTTYAAEAGFNYFSAGIAYGDPGGGSEVVPEPATLAILGLGLAGLGFARARRRK